MTLIPSPLHFWIRTRLALLAIAQALQEASVVGDFHSDGEDTYSWFTCMPLGLDLELNVSRNRWKNRRFEPVVFMVSGNELPTDETVERIAFAVHEALPTTLWIGTINWGKGDDREFIPTTTLPAQPRQGPH